MKQPLKYPNGDFTWAELATCNGTNKPGVWQRFDEAKRNKTIVLAGERPQADGRKGKPEKLWRLVAGQPVPVAAVTAPTPATAPTEVKPTPVVPTEAVVVPAAQPAPVVEAPKQPEPVVAEPVIAEPAKLPETAPAVAPTPAAESSVESVTVEVVRIEPPSEVKPASDVIKDARTLTETCPLCGKPLLAINDATGVMVWCAQGPEVCSPNEAPFGHGKTDKDDQMIY